jgi:outer membrane biosynthesis protein TonB
MSAQRAGIFGLFQKIAPVLVRPIVLNMRKLRRLDLSSSVERSVTKQRVRPRIERGQAMKASMVTVVSLMVVTFALWVGQAEAQHRGGAKAAPAHPPKVSARPVVKAHPPQPKAKAQQKSKGAVAKKPPAEKKQKPPDPAQVKRDEKKKQAAKEKTAAQKEQKSRDLADAKHEEKKKHAAKEKAREHAKKADKKALSPVAARGVPDHESIALLRGVHEKLQMVNHDYGVHRRRATEHVDSALRHLGSSAPASVGSGKGQMNSPQHVSDAVMYEARTSLEMIKNWLAARPGGVDGAAHGAVKAAIHEIDLALAVR